MTRKIKYDGKEYRRRLKQLLEGFAPQTYPCVQCGSPVIDGYCCTYCRNSNPRGF